MKKMIISDEYTVTSSKLGCVELIENGALTISNDLTEVRIHQLINHKGPDSDIKYDIQVTGRDGKDAPYGSGQNGTDGGDGSNVKIIVEDLIGDVWIRARGGCGGCGGSGKDGENGENGGRGGDGGNGGDGAVIDFTYDKKTNRDGMNFAYVESFSGGSGGIGGTGGGCIRGGGRGGQPGKKGGQGARCGEGGRGGKNGKDGTVTIHHPDGSTTVNQREYAVPGNTLPGASFRMVDYSDDMAFRRLLSVYGGELGLEQFPKFKAAIQKAREKARALRRGERQRDQNDQVLIMGSVSSLDILPADSDEADGSKNLQEGMDDFYQMSIDINTVFVNSPAVVTKEENDEVWDSVGYLAEISLCAKNLDDPKAPAEILYGNTFFSDEKGAEFKETLQTDPLPISMLFDRELEMKGIVTYLDSNQVAYSAEFTSGTRETKENLDSLLDQIYISDPHCKAPGKAENQPIMFLYGRTPSSNPEYEDADYWDEDGCYFHNSFNSGVLHTIMPISGTVTLNKRIKIKNVELGSYQNGSGFYHPPYLEYGLTENKRTVARFHWKEDDTKFDDLVKKMKEAGSVSYDAEEQKVSFDLKVKNEDVKFGDYDWDSNLSGSFLQDSSHTCYLSARFVMDVQLETNKDAASTTQSITILSKDKASSFYVSKKGASIVYIPPIKIYWGCHGRGTLVRLAQANGKAIEKPVEEIQQGDVLLGFGGKKLVVSVVMTGEDTSIYRIQTRSGREIKVSGGHAMKKWNPADDQGQRTTAARLKTGDFLMTEAGREEIVFVGVEPYHDTVYNFTFEGEQQPNYILANGFWSGDFYAQNQEEKKPLVLTQETKETVQDMKRLAEKMSENRVSCGKTLPE